MQGSSALNIEDERDDIVHVTKQSQKALSLAIDELKILVAEIVPKDPVRNTIQLEYRKGSGVWFHVKELPDEYRIAVP
ncbi:hypothetical protein MKX08_003442 [Trichoderma sp. CBMAI-0020]|nr:hypothetical protein MKX08_003442 [Trichoderma sp. CBMAI-0020]